MSGRPASATTNAIDTQLWGARARAVVMETERGLGHQPVDVEHLKKGYDIERALLHENQTVSVALIFHRRNQATR
jgi:hypothetical protein